MKHAISKSDLKNVAAASGEFNHDLVAARTFQRGAEWAGVCYSLKGRGDLRRGLRPGVGRPEI